MITMAVARFRLFWIAAALGTSCFAPSPASSDTPSQVPATPQAESTTPTSKSLASEPLGPNAMASFKLVGGTPSDAELSRVGVAGQSFTEAIQVRTNKRPAQT